MKLEFLAISDTHLGEDTSVLCFPQGRQQLCDALPAPFGGVLDAPASLLDAARAAAVAAAGGDRSADLRVSTFMYVSPNSPIQPDEAPAPPPLMDLWVPALLAASVVVVPATLCIARHKLGLFAGGCLAALLGLTALVRAAVVVARRRRSAGRGPWLLLAFGGFGGLFMTAVGSLLALLSTIEITRGRQLRRRGRALLPAIRVGDAWARAPLELRVDEAARREVAARWRENGRTEHASVAAFARLTLDLMALGAPPGLVRDANHDALDEIRHTELCFSLARAIDGASEEPGPFPEAQRARTLPSNRTLALSKLAVDSLIDGALNEGLSARVVARLARRCDEPTIRSVLREIAADEGRHAAHGWDVVEWCVAEGGRPVALALLGAARALPESMKPALPGPAATGAWERWGIFGRTLEAEEYRKTRAHTVARVHALVDVAQTAAAA